MSDRGWFRRQAQRAREDVKSLPAWLRSRADEHYTQWSGQSENIIVTPTDPPHTTAGDAEFFARSLDQSGTPWAIGCAGVLRACASRLAQLEDERRAVVQVLDDFAQCEEKTLPQRLADELADFRMVMDHCSEIYMYLSGGAISKPNTLPREVI